jgi:hypothetical protein
LSAAAIRREPIMSEDDKRGLVRARSSSPAPLTPRPRVPSLPSDSGAIFGSRTRIARKDAEFIETDTRRILAQKAQADAFAGLIESRMTAALSIAKLAALPEMARHEYLHGRAEREAEQDKWEHEARVAALEHKREETNALADLVRAQQRLAELQPKPAPPPQPSASPLAPTPPPPAPVGLTPTDVEDVIASLPEIMPDTLKTISRLLFGLQKEKEKGQ